MAAGGRQRTEDLTHVEYGRESGGFVILERILKFQSLDIHSSLQIKIKLTYFIEIF